MRFSDLLDRTKTKELTQAAVPELRRCPRRARCPSSAYIVDSLDYSEFAVGTQQTQICR